ncbi:MAG TPA: TetR/AcrR family transcriptional regulator [Streptosporangiaceae bacterium]|nr:TetR/AcrR family transcriptional regulator [Streptosporangiaceae bacterium]
MSPRKPAVLREQGGESLREHLIAAAARLIDQRGAAGLSVRDIAREAGVADGVLYNYFADKEDLLAHALLAHVGAVMASAPQLLPPAGTGTVADNLQMFVERGFAVLSRVTPAFAGLVSQPNVLTRFHRMVGGDAAFSAAPAGHGAHRAPADGDGGGRGFGEMLTRYLEAEQAVGRIDDAADTGALTVLLVGAIHGLVLPRVLFNPPGATISMPPGLAERIVRATIIGIAPA